MAGRSRFFDEMHPRNFPSDKKQSGWVKTQAIAPKPSLPGASLIVHKHQLTKAAPKKSFLKWKQQHETLFHRTDAHQITGFVNQRQLSPQSPDVANKKFELDFHKVGLIQQIADREEEHQHMANNCHKFENEFVDDAAIRPQFQSMMAFSQLNRVARSEAMNSNVPLEGKPTEDQQSNPCTCHCNVAVSSSEAQNTELDSTLRTESNLQSIDSMEKAVVLPKRPLANKVLANIVEDQIEIVEQQKQILKQQNEIFQLQYQIEKLLLKNNELQCPSPMKQLQCSPIRKSITPSPCAQSNAVSMENSALANGFSPLSLSSPQTRQSIGVMTSFHDNSHEVCSPNRNPNLSPYQNGSSSKEDTMLERINKIIKNSPPMINHKVNSGAHKSRSSPLRADINISSQTLIYKTSTRNNISIGESPPVADRSFALHLLDMKYNPGTPNALSQQKNAIEKRKRNSPKSPVNDFVPSNISPDKYDYLIRHGLLNQ